MSFELSEFFKLVSEDKKKKKEEFNSIVGDLELDSLFGEFSALKKKEAEKRIEEKKIEDSLILDINLNIDSVFQEVTNLKKENKKKKIQEQKTVKAFEKWLYSETPKQEEKIIKNTIEDSLEEVLQVLEDHKEELCDIDKSKEVVAEKSLGLLSEPSEIKQQSDSITPLDKKFATLDDLQNHYKIFLNRIQQQLSTLGGGGETRLEFLDDIDRDSAKIDNYYLKYDSTKNKWVGAAVTSGGGGGAGGTQTLDQTLNYGNTSTLGMSVGIITSTNFIGNLTGTATTALISTYATSSGISTYATSSGISTYATTSGISTYATTSGISTYATTSGISTYATSSGIATYATTSGISTSTQTFISNEASIISGVTTTNTSLQTAIDIFSSSFHRSAKYQIQVVEGTSYHTTEFSIVHDGTNTYNTEYGTLKTEKLLATFDSDIDSGNIRLLATPSSSSPTTFKLIRILINS